MVLTEILAIALSAIIIVGIIAIAILKNSRYKRAAEQCRADAQREQEWLTHRPLSPVDREHFGREWRLVEAHFAEDPRNAVAEADRVVEELLSATGYSVSELKVNSSAAVASNAGPAISPAPRASALAPNLTAQLPIVESYREAHEIVLKQAQGHAGGKELQRAMIDYRVVFDDLLGGPEAQLQSQEPENEEANARSGG